MTSNVQDGAFRLTVRTPVMLQKIFLSLLVLIFWVSTLPGLADPDPGASIVTQAMTADAQSGAQVRGEQASASAAQVPLDLSSQTGVMRIDSSLLPNGASATINVGGSQTVVRAGDLMTAAEYAAVLQVVHSGNQSLVLDSVGRATGGSLVLNAIVGSQGANAAVASLLVPTGVTAIHDFATNSALNVVGDITNAGTFYAVSSNSQVINATIAGNSLFNQAGALLTSVVPTGGIAGFSSLFPLNLSLVLQNSLVNQGSISSSGNLNIVAANVTNSGMLAAAVNTAVSVANQLQNTSTGQIIAANAVNINAGSLVNSGLISAQGANLSIAGLLGNALTVNNVSGLMQANAAQILVNSTAGIDLTGGTLSAASLKFASPQSRVAIDVDRLDGPVSVKGDFASVNVAGGNLHLVEVDVSGDPIFSNNSSDLTLPAVITTSSGPLTAIAAGSILGDPTSGTTIDTRGSSGGDVIMIAGANHGPGGGGIIVTGPSGLTGSILGIKSINTSGSPSGNIVLAAYGGSVTVNGSLTAQGGNEYTPPSNSPSFTLPGGIVITPPSSGGNNNQAPVVKGLVRIFAPEGVHVGDITTDGTKPAINQVEISTSNPSLVSGLTFNSAGALTAGGIVAGSQIMQGAVTTGNIDTGWEGAVGLSAGSVSVVAGGSINTGFIRAMGGGEPGIVSSNKGWNYAAPGGNSGNVRLNSTDGSVLVNGDINTAGGGGGGSSNGVGGRGGDGGSVTIAAKGNVTVNGPILTAGGGGGGGVGICSCDTAGGGGSLGNSGGPMSGGVFQSWPPYQGAVLLDAGIVIGNPNHPPYPYPGQGGSNTSYDLGCCGGGRGGDVGQTGSHGGTGTFQRGYWNDTTPMPGGPPGVSGSISISGRDISITKTLGSFYGGQSYASSSPYAPYSIFSYSQAGGGAVQINSFEVRTATNVYDANANFATTTASVSAQMRAGQLNVAGRVAGNSIALNSTAFGTSLDPGIYQLPLSGPAQLTIVENGVSKTISNNQLVTPAEWVALIQRSTTLTQSIVLGAGGFASGGTLGIAVDNLPAGGFSILSIPQNVAVQSMVANILVNGPAVVDGILQFAAPGAISASSVSIGSSGILSSTAPGGTLSVNTPNLTLATNSTISSIGDLLISSVSAMSALSVVLPDGSAAVNSQSGSIKFRAGDGHDLSFLSTAGAASSMLMLGGPTTLEVSNAALNVGSAVTLSTNGFLTAQLNNGQLANGGTLKSALAGGAPGAITFASTGSLQVSNLGNLLVAGSSATGGAGGAIAFSAPAGNLSLAGTTISANAFGAGSNNGGHLRIAASSLTINGSAPLILEAIATGSGNGGEVTVTVSGAGQALVVGSAAQQIEVFATGGSSGSAGGDGGRVEFAAGGNLTVNPAAIHAAPSGSSGAGAKLKFSAGIGWQGDLLVSGMLNASGVGSGSGGAIELSSNSSTTFVIGAAAINGSIGAFIADAGVDGGAGGALSITNTGTGGVSLPSESNVSLRAAVSGGDGGRLALSAPAGVLSLPGGTYAFDGIGPSGAGGRIVLLAKQLNVMTGPAPQNETGLTLSAIGAGGGAGGLVSVTVTGADQDLSTGNSDGNVTAFATGGSLNSLTGDGGEIVLSAGRNLTVDPLQVSAQPNGQNGKGARFTFIAGTAGVGDLFIDGNLDASGKGNGAGGGIFLGTNSTNDFRLGDGVVSGVGNLVADAGIDGGAGGVVSVINNGAGGIVLPAFSNVSMLPSQSGGAGGKFVLKAFGGTLTIPDGVLSVSAVSGATGFKGGEIEFVGSAIVQSGHSGLTMTANAAGAGDGGKITLEVTSPTFDLVIGSGDQTFALWAMGGTSTAPSSAGNGGILAVTSARNLTVNPLFFVAGPRGSNGDGAQFSLTAGKGGSGNLSIQGNLVANGVGNGAGGAVSLSVNSASVFLLNSGSTNNGVFGVVQADAGAGSGKGGRVSIANAGSGGVKLAAAGGILARASQGGGGGGTIQILAPQGMLELAGGTLAVDAIGSSSAGLNGGIIELVGLGLNVVGQSALALSANGSTGDGGFLSVSTLGASGDLILANASGAITVSAAGGGLQTTGNGGGVSVLSGRNLTVQGGAINLQPLGSAARGGTLTLKAGQVVAGDLIVNTGLDLSGVGGGDGGILTLAAHGLVQLTGVISVVGSDRSSALQAGNGGILSIQSDSLISISGSILAGGGTNGSSGAGGNAGQIALSTNNNNPRHFYTGSVKIGGIIDMHGGNSTGGGSGGAGGGLSVRSGTFQVIGALSGVSINAAAGVTAQSISIETFGTQPLPVNFDLTNSSKEEIALPGGMFSVGDSTSNGTTGSIIGVGGSATVSNASRLVDSSGTFVRGNISITATGSSGSINSGGVNVSVSSDNGAGARIKINPGQALALFQVSRGLTQTIQLSRPDQGSQVLDGSSINVDGFELFRPFSSFNLRTANSSVNLFTMNVTGRGATLLLSSSNTITIGGSINLLDPSSQLTFDLGSRGSTLENTGSITGSATSQLIVRGSGGGLDIKGPIRAGNILFNFGASSLSVNMSGNGKIGGPISGSGIVTLTGDSVSVSGGQIVNAVLQFGSVNTLPSVNLNTSFGVGGFLGSASTRQLSVNLPGNLSIMDGAVVSSTGGISFNGPGTLMFGSVAGGVLVQGNNNVSINVGRITANGTGNSVVSTSGAIQLSSSNGIDLGSAAVLNARGDLSISTSNAILRIGDNSSITARGNVGLSATGNGSGINLGSSIIVSAGKLVDGVPDLVPLSSNQIVQQGGLSIQSSGAAGIQVGAGAKFSANGGNAQFNSSAQGASISLPDSVTIAANGGNVSIEAQNQIQLGALNKVIARTLNGGGGQISFNASQGFSAGSGTTISGLGSVLVNSQNGAITFAGANPIVVTAGQSMTLNGLTIAINAAASLTAGQSMQFNANNGITIMTGAQVLSGQSMSLQTQRTIALESGVTLSAASSTIQLSTSGPLGLISVGSGVQITAGTLNGAPGFVGLTQANIQKSGGINIQAQGSGGLVMAGGGATSLIANGGDVQISMFVPAAGMVLPDGTSIIANGGNVSIATNGPGAVDAQSNVSIKASTYNNGNGNVQINLPGGLKMGAGSELRALGQVQVNTNNGAFQFNGTMLSSGQAMSIQGLSGVTLGTGAVVSAGNSLQVNVNASGAAIAIGANATVTAVNGLQMTANGSNTAVAIGANAVVSGGNGLQVNAGGSNAVVTIGANAQLIGGTGLQINANSQGSTITVGAGAQFVAGVLNGTPAFGPITQANILKSGGINIQAQGSGGQGLVLQGAATFISNGGNIQVSALVPAGGFNYASGTVFTANGGNVQIGLTTSGAAAMSNFGATIQASTLNGGSGAIQIGAQSGLTMGAGSVVNGLGEVQVSVSNGVFAFNGTTMSSGKSMNIQGQGGVTIGDGAVVNGGTGLQIVANSQNSTVTIGKGAQLIAGALNGTPGFVGLTQANIQRFGGINIQAQGSGGLVMVGGGATSLTSNGGDVQISMFVPIAGMVMPDGTTIIANGGNVSISSNGPGAIDAQSNVSIKASTYNNSNGNVQIGVPGGMKMGAGSELRGLGQVQVNTNNGAFQFNGANLSSLQSMSIQSLSGVTLGAGAAVSTASSLQVSASANAAAIVIGANATVGAANVLQIVANGSNTTVAIGASAIVNGGNGLQVNAGGSNASLTIGANAQLSGGTGLQINANSQGSTITVGAGAQFVAGVLNGTPAFGPMTQANILKSGGINIQVQGGGGQGLVLQGAATFVANGGNIQVSSLVPAAGLTWPSGTVFTANGGNVQIGLSTSGAAGMSNFGATIQASTLNGGSGAIQIGAQSGLTMGAGSVVNGLGEVQVSVSNGVFAFNGTTMSSGKSMNIQGQGGVTIGDGAVVNGGTGLQIVANSQNSTVTIGKGAQLTAGALNGTPGFVGLTQANIQRFGGINIQAQGSGGLVMVGGGATSLTSNGGDVQISMFVPVVGMVMPDGTTIIANGGNVSISSNGAGAIDAQSNVSIKASTYNNSNGNVQVSVPGGMKMGTGSELRGLGQVQVNTNNGAFQFNGAMLSSVQAMNIQGQTGVTFGTGAIVNTANNLQVTTNATGAAVLIGANAAVSSVGGLQITANGNNTVVTIGASAVVNGGNGLQISANGNGSVLTIGANSAVSSANGMQISANGNSGALTIGSGVVLNGGNGLQLNATGSNASLAIGANAQLSGGTGLQINANSQGSTITVGAGAQFVAGVLNGTPAFGPMTQANILKSGGITIQAQGSGGQGLLLQGAATFVSNGGNIQVSSLVPAGGLTWPVGTVFTANGGNVQIGLTTSGAAGMSNINATIQASTLNGGSGAIQIGAQSGLTMGGGSSINGLGEVQVSVSNGVFAFNGTTMSSGKSMNIQGQGGVTIGDGAVVNGGTGLQIVSNSQNSTVTIGMGAQLIAGALNGTPGFVGLTQANIQRFGGINIQAQGSGGLVMAGGGATSLTSNGADVQINMFVPVAGMVMPDGTAIIANGGNVSISSNGPGAIDAQSNVSIKASTYNNSNGNVQINVPGGMKMGTGSELRGLGQVQVNTNNGAFQFNGAMLSSVQSMNIQGQTGVTFGAGAIVNTANSLQVTTNASGSAVLIGANAAVSSVGGLQITANGNNTVVMFGASTVVNGGNGLQVSANGNGSVLTIGANAAVSSANGIQISANGSSGVLTIGSGAVLNGGNGLQLNATGSNAVLTIGANAQLSGGTGLQVNANSQGATVTVGAGAQFVAGVLNGTPAFGPMMQANILKSGGINIQVQGGGGQGLSLQGAATFVSNGGNIQVSSLVPAGGLTWPSGTVFTANGGNVQIGLSTSGTAGMSNINATIQASTINNANGMVQISSQSALTIGSGSAVTGLGSVQIGINNGSFVFSGSAVATSSSLSIFGQSGVSIGTGSITTVSSVSQLQLSSSSGAIVIGDNVALGSSNGSVTMQSPGNLSIGNGSTIAGATGVVLGAAGQSSTLTISGSVNAGSFINPAIPFGPVLSNQVKTSGSVVIVASGSGGLLFQPNSAATISAIGGSVTLNSNGQGINVVVGDGVHSAQITAHGGSVQLSASGQLALNAMSAVSASTLNGQLGSVNVSGNQAVTIQPKASLNALGAVGINSSSLSIGGVLNAGSTGTLTATNALSIGNAATLSTGNTLVLNQTNGSTAIAIGQGSQLAAGQLLNDSGTGVVNTQVVTVVKSGAILINSSGRISVGQGVSMISNAGDVSLIANGNIVLDSSTSAPSTQTVFKANGGNVFVMSQKTVSQSSGAATGNTFIARAIGTSANNTSGGGIQLSSGTTSAQVQADLSKPAGTQPLLLSTLGLGAVNVSNTNGAIVTNIQGGGAVNLAGAGNASTLTLDRGAMHFDAIGLNSAVTINQGTFQTFGFRPVSFVTSTLPPGEENIPAEAQQGTKVLEGKIDASESKWRSVKALKILSEPGAEFAQDLVGWLHLKGGSIFIDAPNAARVRTRYADVYVGGSALVQVSVSEGKVTVRACSGVRDVTVVFAGSRIDLCSGQEVQVMNRQPQSSDLLPGDGIGRRHQHSYPLPGGLHATVSDFSLVSAIVNTSKLTELKHSALGADQRLLKRLIRAAASVDVVMRNKGIYKATPRPQQFIDESGYTEAYGQGKLRLPPSEYYSSKLP